MIDRRNEQRRLHERGAALPIVALLAFALIAVLAVLGIDTSRVKSEGALLRRRVETMCRATARHALIPERAIKVFQVYVNQMELSQGTKISSARLVLPLALNGDITDIYFDPDKANASCQATTDPSIPRPYTPSASGAYPIPFADLRTQALENGLSINPYRCSNTRHFEDESVDCLLYPSVCSPGGEPNPNYPTSMWSDIVNAGNTIGCEIDASIPPLLPFLPAREITAKAAWWTPLKTVAPYLENGIGSGSSNADFAGLSIGVATQLTTWAGELPSGARLGDDRFRFLDIDDPILAQLDPRRPTPPGFVRERFTFDNPAKILDETFIVPSIPNLVDASTDTDRQHEMLTACFNPVVLARNLLLSTLVEYASRSGQTRSMTEIAHLNPRHFGPNPPANRPVVMVPFGADLLSPRFQAPFVTYNSGGVFEKGGFITPWKNFGSDPQRATHHALIAQQLRACYHLFIDNDQSSTILHFPSPLGQGFNPLIPPPMRLTTYNLHQSFALPSHWDYSVPWSTNLPSDNGRRLTAPELLYSLGSTQACPIDRNVGGAPSLSLDCTKTGIGAFNDLLPDIEGYLDYQVSGQDGAYPSPGLSRPRRENGSIIVPSYGDESEPDLESPLAERTSVDTKIARSAVVLVTHKPLPTDHVNSVRDRVRELNGAQRPVVIIFLPATHADSGYFSNYCKALDLGNDCSNDGSPSLNSFIFLSPFNAAYGQRYTHDTEGAARTEDAVFRRYWLDLLLDDPLYTDDPYYLDIARALFVDTLSKLEPKL